MAKDGTMRGGARPGSGQKRKAVTDKVAEGRSATLIPLPQPDDLDYDPLNAEPVPPMKDYLKAAQKKGEILQTKDVYEDTYRWLDKLHCRHVVAPQLVEQYSMSVARWIQCEQAISEHGLLAAHPTTKVAVSSPYVTIANNYMKQANQLWFTIYQAVRENASVTYNGATPQDNVMEKLLSVRGG